MKSVASAISRLLLELALKISSGSAFFVTLPQH
jgi:hypothetical protein